jgi:hypothetical protein
MVKFRRTMIVLAPSVLATGLLSGTAPATPGSGITVTNLARATVADAIDLNVELTQG